MATPPVAVARLRKSFGEQTVLDGITFQLESGKVTCVLGRSGTGKSVLLRLLIGLETADAGSICLEGREISTGSPRQAEFDTRSETGGLSMCPANRHAAAERRAASSNGLGLIAGPSQAAGVQNRIDQTQYPFLNTPFSNTPS
jgi:ABC-type glutathione transport system ATPase component